MKLLNRLTAIWTACVAFVAGCFIYLNLGSFSATNPAPDWVSFGMIGAVALGSLTLLVMILEFLICLVRRKRLEYKPFLGISTNRYMVYGGLLVGLIFLQLFQLSKNQVPTIHDNFPIAASFYSPTPQPTPKPKIVAQAPKDNGEPWGVQKQVDDVTWTMKVGHDATMATPREIFDALNEYRVRQGVNRLEWNDKLAGLAQLRCDQQVAKGGLDSHAGFKEFTADQNKMRELGFWDISENASYGYKLSGVHIIEWAYSDPPHDNNQKNGRWNIVGIAVKGTCTDLIFGR